MKLWEDRSDGAGEPMAEGHSAGSVHVPELIIYERIDFGGASWRTNLGHCTLGDAWSRGFRSLIVVSGSWVFYEESDFGGATTQLEPGYYRSTRDAGLPGDRAGSFRPIAF